MKKSSSWFSLSLAIILALVVCVTTFAQNTNTVAEREATRRQAALPRGQEALGRAKAAMAEGNYTVAREEFRAALTFLPDAVISEKSHDEAVAGFCASGMKLAEQKVAEGKYGKAEAICREILSNRYDPNCRPAAEMLARLQAPGTVNRTVGPKFLSKVEEVKRLLVDAEGYYMSGRYDLAFKKYEQVLALDPYNVAARRGEERLNLTKTHYGEEAYNETRSRQLWEVQKG
jgi:general secretion pathway protein D